jgi:hypothetical protein
MVPENCIDPCQPMIAQACNYAHRVFPRSSPFCAPRRHAPRPSLSGRARSRTMVLPRRSLQARHVAHGRGR